MTAPAALLEGERYGDYRHLDLPAQQFFAEVDAYLAERREHIVPQSAEDIFCDLLEAGKQARINGNYGIAASVVIVSGSDEIRIIGANTLVSEQDPAGHAEMNAVKLARQLKMTIEGITADLQAHKITPLEADFMQAQVFNDLVASGQVKIIPNSANKSDGVKLYTTLEPCPMCTVGACVNAGINHIVIGAADAYSGSLAPEGLAKLPPIWKILADKQGTVAEFCQDQDPTDPNTYLPPKLLELLKTLFFQHREVLDKHLEEDGFLTTFEATMATGLLAWRRAQSAPI